MDILWLLARYSTAIIPAAVATLVICIALETVGGREGNKPKRWPGILITLTLPILAALISLPLRLMWRKLGVPPLLDITAWHPLAQVVLFLTFTDFLRYWEHRFEHRFWWPVHAVHHSQTDLHSANAYGHPLQQIPDFLLILIPMSLVASNSFAPPLVGFLLGLQVMLIHAPLRWHLGPLRRVIVDGPYHRIHHSLEPRHFGRNFGVFLSIWDQLFKTAYFPAKDEWPDTGLEDMAPPTGLADCLLKPLQLAPTGRTPESPQPYRAG